MCKNRYLNIINCTTIFFCQTCNIINNKLIICIKNIFLPSHRSIIDFSINRTDTLKILFTNITKRKSSTYTTMKSLRYFRLESNITQYISSIDTYRKIITMITNLSTKQCATSTQENKNN